MRRSQVHIPGIVECRALGVIEGFAGVRIGDRVEVSPQSPFSAARLRRDEYWVIVRKLEAERDV